MEFKYPYTDFHELNLDYIMSMVRDTMGLHFAFRDNKLYLLNANEDPLSKITIGYADKALQDVDGRDIKTYIISAGIDGNRIIFTDGFNQITSLTIPYAIKASEDINGSDITDYIKSVSVAGDKLRITSGSGSYEELTLPFAVKASTDIDGKLITSYASTITVDGNNIILKDANNNQIASITVPYATKALQDVDGDDIKSTYGAGVTTGTNTIKLVDKAGNVINEITVPYATIAGNTERADVSTHSTNSIESVTISGDNVLFTTYGGSVTTIQIPYSVKAQKDDLGNNIKSTYVADVTNDNQTGELTFLDAQGNTIISLVPTVSRASRDSYNNLIADFVKTIAVSSNSNYVTVTHGTGTADSITIHYSETAWKDTNNNVIKNTYITDIECVQDVNDGHYKLVAYDGDTPKAELFRTDVLAYQAQTALHANTATTATTATRAIKDVNGRDLVSLPSTASYIINVSQNAGNTSFTVDSVEDSAGNEVDFNDMDITASIYIKTQTYHTSGQVPVDYYKVTKIYDVRELGGGPVYFEAIYSFDTTITSGGVSTDVMKNIRYSVGYVNDSWLTGTITTKYTEIFTPS